MRSTPMSPDEYRRSWAEEHPDTPYGHCQCGCGQKTTIAKKTSRRQGHVKGEPVRFLTGHTQEVKKQREQRAQMLGPTL